MKILINWSYYGSLKDSKIIGDKNIKHGVGVGGGIISASRHQTVNCKIDVL